MEFDEFGNARESMPATSTKATVPLLPVLPESTDIRDRAKSVEGDIFAIYYTLMMDEETPPAIRKSCADALADRARGKPAQSIDMTAKVTHETLIIQRTPKNPVIDV